MVVHEANGYSAHLHIRSFARPRHEFQADKHVHVHHQSYVNVGVRDVAVGVLFELVALFVLHVCIRTWAKHAFKVL